MSRESMNLEDLAEKTGKTPDAVRTEINMKKANALTGTLTLTGRPARSQLYHTKNWLDSLDIPYEVHDKGVIEIRGEGFTILIEKV